MTSTTLEIRGMSCDHCVRAVSRALAGISGVEVESVRLGRADVRYDETRVTPGELTRAVADAGYPATVTNGGS